MRVGESEVSSAGSLRPRSPRTRTAEIRSRAGTAGDCVGGSRRWVGRVLCVEGVSGCPDNPLPHFRGLHFHFPFRCAAFLPSPLCETAPQGRPCCCNPGRRAALPAAESGGSPWGLNSAPRCGVTLIPAGLSRFLCRPLWAWLGAACPFTSHAGSYRFPYPVPGACDVTRLPLGTSRHKEGSGRVGGHRPGLSCLWSSVLCQVTQG